MKNYTLILSTLLLSNAANAATVKIGVLAPVTGSISAIGLDVKRGAELAVAQRRAEFARMGITLETVLLDDQGDATTGAAQVENAMKDPLLLGVIGPTKSGVSLKVGEMLARSTNPLPFISPASTNDDLTKNKWTFFFRMTSPDGAQADTAATYIAREIKAKSVFIVSDNQTFANGIAGVLGAELKQRRISTQLGAANVGDVKAQAALVERIKAAKPDLVFYAGLYDGGGPFIRALRAAGVTTSFMGGNGLDSPEFVRLAQGDAGGTRFITGFGPVQNYVNGQNYISDFQKAYNTPPAVRSAFTYDSMNTMLNALANSYHSLRKVPTRAQLISAVQSVNSPTNRNVTGAIAFTPTGERRSSPMFVVEIDAHTLATNVIYGTRYAAPR
ncbi:branched-chain amino acid ABC transporter substrate-binding protein [Deinococcus hopiensis]|uniref:Amino acid/amide ABC transporter substrate-binding protein, HAAT family n=1 Tax=Deinococcus hopiensis KR-140 TaxID=695939 RepID=A0A1W1UWZ9_9DEIO|nr:branched-chain amino acid ABC transporter substrate-binding protein [Deinococcus hopiensis]SMB85617.1 amino acid/amide ABC transporter substrate-binding protein, HAAT family [Deinococcus hopiensis KR-140]